MQTASDSIARQLGETHKIGAGSLAALSLIVANLGLLFFYFAFDLTLFQVVFVYWFEVLWIGLFSGLKLLTASLFGSPYENRWVEVSGFGAFLLSLFALAKASGAFLLLLTFTGVALVAAQQELTGTDGTDFLHEHIVLMLRCSMLFSVGHGISFVINFLILGEFRNARFGTLIWLPFKRSSALFVAIVVAITAIYLFPGVLNETAFAVILIALKLAWDYFLHRRERLSFTTAGLQRDAA